MRQQVQDFQGYKSSEIECQPCQSKDELTRRVLPLGWIYHSVSADPSLLVSLSQKLDQEQEPDI